MFKLRVLRGKSHNRAEGLESRVHAGVSHIFKLGVNLSSVPTGIHKVRKCVPLNYQRMYF